jgi:hypothetical protein
MIWAYLSGNKKLCISCDTNPYGDKINFFLTQACLLTGTEQKEENQNQTEEGERTSPTHTTTAAGTHAGNENQRQWKSSRDNRRPQQVEKRPGAGLPELEDEPLGEEFSAKRSICKRTELRAAVDRRGAGNSKTNPGGARSEQEQLSRGLGAKAPGCTQRCQRKMIDQKTETRSSNKKKISDVVPT